MVAKNILVVDDSSLARKQLIKALPRDWELQITQASNGLEALSAIRAARYDVVFLDLTMPEMDGFEVLSAIQNESMPPVIVVSADIQPEAQERVRALGALGFVRKPAGAVELSAALESYGVR